MSLKTSKEVEKPAKNRFGLWQATIDSALSDRRWHAYDCDIQAAVNRFNRHLTGTPNYYFLDWRLVKAMVWTESGGPTNRAWSTRPIQIGNPGDPGLRALFSDKEGGPLILPPDMKDRLTLASATATPQMNIQAGIGYLLMRLAKFGTATVTDATDNKVYEIAAKPGDTFERIARTNRTTVDTLKTLNKNMLTLRPGQTLRFQKASVRKVITRWDPPTPRNIAARYNVGDPDYARKLEYCLSVIRKAQEETACAQ
ncbi:LysM peptidoglycan-binding domain-containing protein [Massilia sp. LXY-6]|uniref:LysM peptidoglycan-binding domain-containing protein n=1 Tax=Massilia sp. LXY-6 TaxID=3379823 RepID=UPI003EDF8BCC